MFIYHFNRLIRNRLLWGFFAIIIAVAFVAVDSCFRNPADAHPAGRMNGKKISTSRFDQIVHSLRGNGRNRDNETPNHVIDRRAWEQIAAVENAAGNGMKTSVPEIQAALREMPAFQGSNGFDMERYKMMVRNMGFTPEYYEKLLAHQLTLMKSATLVNSASWISPMELDSELASMTDRFTVQIAYVSNTFANAEMPLKDEDYKKYYEEHKESFGLPDRIQVRYVVIPATNYLAVATTPDDAELQDYYDTNSDKYTRTTTNNTTETIPFEEVRGKIMDELKLQAAVYAASTSATFRVYSDVINTNVQKDVLGEFAKAEKLTVQTSPFFSVNDPLPWVESGNGRKFSEAVFELDPERVDSRFCVVECTKSVYVVELVKREEAHVPPYEEVVASVKTRTLNQARTDAFEKVVKEKKEGLDKEMSAGKAFADAAKGLGMNVSTSITYTVSDMQNVRFDNSFSVAYGARSVLKGKVSDAIPASSKLSLLVYVQDRQPGDPLSSEMIRSQIRSSRAGRGGDKFSEWLKWDLAQQKFEPAKALLPEDATIKDDSETDPEVVE